MDTPPFCKNILFKVLEFSLNGSWNSWKSLGIFIEKAVITLYVLLDIGLSVFFISSIHSRNDKYLIATQG